MKHRSISSFTIYPAIDLRHGKVVRLQYGDPNLQTTFSDDPLAIGRKWLEAGATWLHVVNLDGAFDEAGRENWQAILQLTPLNCQIQLGGGLRTLADIGRALAIGVNRVVLGTAAVENPELVKSAVEKFGAERIVVGLDARNGIVQTHGWQTPTPYTTIALGQEMESLGVKTVLHTDIGRDGVLTGVNWQASQALAEATKLKVIASGGVATREDVMACAKSSGIEGMIIGRAIYTGGIDLTDAIQLAAEVRR